MVQHVWVFVLALLATVVLWLRVPHNSSKSSNHANKGVRRGL